MGVCCMGIETELPVKGFITVKAWKDGQVCHTVSAHNLITSVGKNLIANILANTDGYGTGLTYCALGTVAGTPVVGGTVLGAEVVRAAVNSFEVAVGVVSCETFFFKTAAPYSIAEVGHFGHDAGTALNSGRLFEWATINFDNSSTVYDISVLYQLSIG